MKLYLKGSKREGERDVPSLGSFLKCLQKSRPDQAGDKARPDGVKSQQVYLGLLHGWLGCFLGSVLARN